MKISYWILPEFAFLRNDQNVFDGKQSETEYMKCKSKS